MGSTSPRRLMVARLAWVLPVGMTAAVYWPLTGNYFTGDDFFHLWQLANEGLGRFVLSMHGGHIYVTRNLVFALFFYLFGTHAAPYFCAVLLTHLLNVYLLFAVVRSLVGGWRLPCLSAAIWGMAPVNEGALGWYSAYGHVLAGTCILWVLTRLVQVRAGEPLRPAVPWLWALVIVIAGTCFGVGIGIALVMPALAWVLLPAGRSRAMAVTALALGALAMLALYLAVPRVYLALYDGARSWGSLQPVASWWRTAEFFAVLAGYGVVAPLLGPLDRPDVYPGLIGVGIIGLSVMLAAIALYRAPRRTWRPLLACVILAAASYGMVAAGRAYFVNATTLAWMARTGRYHYVGTCATAIAISVVLGGLGHGWRLPQSAKNAALVAWAVAAMLIALVFGQPINHFDHARVETTQALTAIRSAIEAAAPGMDVRITNRPFAAVGFVLGGNMAAFPGWAALFAIFYSEDVVDGHRVYFVINDRDTLNAARHGARAMQLLRGPTETS